MRSRIPKSHDHSDSLADQNPNEQFSSHPQISRVSSEAFAEMPSLAELDLSRNKLLADAVDGPIFNLPQVQTQNFNQIFLAFDLNFHFSSSKSSTYLSINCPS